MQSYLFIESRDPFESSDVTFLCELAAGLAKAGHAVTVYLVQNGVMPARRGAKAEDLRSLVRSGVKVVADDFSLAERGIDASRLAAGIEPAPIDVIVDHLSAGHKVLWH